MKHPIYHLPQLRCGKCNNILAQPRNKKAVDADIAAGRAVLMECITCAVGLPVPAELFKASDHIHLDTVEVTHAMRVQRPPK